MRVMQMTYQEKLKGLREDRDLTQKQVADLLGVAQTTYSQYELGKRPLPIDCLIILCKFYNVSSDEVLGLHRVVRKNESRGKLNFGGIT